MNASNYIRFANYFRAFEYTSKHSPAHILSEGRPTSSFLDNINHGIAHCKVFEIEEDIKKLLILTKTPDKNQDIRLPFPYMFLDVNFTREELEELGVKIRAREIVGILFTEGTLLYDPKEEERQEWLRKVEQSIRDAERDEATLIIPMSNPKTILETKEPEGKAGKGIEAGRALRITMYSFQHEEERDGQGWFDTFNRNFDLKDEFKKFNTTILQVKMTDKRAKDFVHRFVLNFLNFMHNPEIEYVEHVRSKKNMERRKKAGKPALPSTNKIRVTGTLKRYIDALNYGGHLSSRYGYRFWVRGHFRNYSANRYKDMKGKKQWILPYIKGQGILIEKNYKVTGGENDGAA